MLKEYTVYMEWDSYEGSLFMETHASPIMAHSRQDAKDRASSQYGHQKGFRITDING